jgi:type IX secretion system substrate protein
LYNIFQYIYIVAITDTTNRNSITPGFADNDNSSHINSTDFKVYPNPAKDKLFIQSAKQATFVLADANGKKYFTTIVNGRAEINISTFPAGVYFLKNVGNSKTEKIVISRNNYFMVGL